MNEFLIEVPVSMVEPIALRLINPPKEMKDTYLELKHYLDCLLADAKIRDKQVIKMYEPMRAVELFMLLDSFDDVETLHTVTEAVHECVYKSNPWPLMVILSMVLDEKQKAS